MLIDQSSLGEFTRQKVGAFDYRKRLLEARNIRPERATVTVFLSHSHSDRKYIQDVIILLNSHGIIIYVDWIDDSLPAITSGETARKLKRRVKQCNKFVFLATNSSVESKWCNWELGIGDGEKFPDHIALFPLSDSGVFKGKEYFEIYPRIEKTSVYGTDLVLKYPDGREIPLDRWLFRN